MKRGYRGNHKGSTLKARIKNTPRAVLNSVLTVVLVVGLAPGISFAAGDAATVSANEGEAHEVVVEQTAPEPEETAPVAEEPVVAQPEAGAQMQATAIEAAAVPQPLSMTAAAVTADNITITPSVAEGKQSKKADAAFYANDDVTVSIVVSESLAEGSTIKIAGGSSEVNETIAAGEAGKESYELSTTVTKEGSSTVTVTVTPKDESSVSKTQEIVIDKVGVTTAPKVTVTPAASDVTTASTDSKVWFDLNSTTLKVEAQTADKSYAFDKANSVLKLGNTEVKTWNAADTDAYKAEATMTAADLTSGVTAIVTLKDVFGNSQDYKLVYDSGFKFVPAENEASAISLESESASLPDDVDDVIKLEGTAGSDGYYKDGVAVTVSLSNEVLQNSNLKNTKPTIAANQTATLSFGDLADNAYKVTAPKEDGSTVEYTVNAGVTTEHGATKAYSKTFSIDGKAPTLAVSWNDDAITNKKQETGEKGVWVYGENRIANISLSDDTGLNAEDIAAVNNAIEDAGGKLSDQNPATLDSATKTYSVTATFDATKADEYTFIIPTVHDVAGNPMTCTDAHFDVDGAVYSDSFKILKNSLLTITPDETTNAGNVSDIALYKDTRKIELTMQTLGAFGTAPTLTITKDGTAGTAVALDHDWASTDGGITYTATVSLPGTATYKDLVIDWDTNTFVVGNGTAASKYTYAGEFIVDAGAPKLTVAWEDDPSSTEVGEDVYYGSQRKAIITIEDETALDADTLADINVEANHLGGTATEKEKTDKKYVLEVTFDKNRYKGDDVCSLIAGGAKDKAGHPLIAADEATKAHFVESTHTYTEPSFKMLVNPTLTVKSVKKQEDIEVPVGGKTYYKSPLTVTWALEAVSLDQAQKLTITPAVTAKENAGWKPVDGEDLAFTADVVFEDTNGAMTNGITVASTALKFYPPNEAAQNGASEELTDSYTFIPKDFAVDNTPPTLKVGWATSAATPAVVETVDAANNIRYYRGGVAGDSVVTATFTVTETNPLGSGDIVVAYGDGSAAVDLSGETASSGVYTLTHEYKGDGTYTVSVNGDGEKDAAHDIVGLPMEAADASTTVSGGTYETTVVIDQTPPKVAVNYYTDYGAASQAAATLIDGVNYANKQITAEIVVTETNFDDSALNMIDADGGAIRTELGKQWKDNKDGTYTALVDFDADANTDEQFQLAVTAVDKAGNPSEPAKIGGTVVVDKVKPTLTVTFPESVSTEKEAESGEIRHYDGSGEANKVVAQLTIVDKYLDPTSITPTAGAFSGWTTSGDTHTATVTFDAPAKGEDVSYALGLSGADKSGNLLISGDAKTTYVSEGAYGTTVVIDDKAPVLSVEWDNNSVLNGFYYKDKRSATIKVDEKYFDPKRISVDGKATTADDWDTNGTVHSYTVEKSYDEGQDHQLTVEGTDRSNNALVGGDDAAADANHHVVTAGKYDSGRFVVDLTDPVITIKMLQARTNVFGGVDYYRLGNQLSVNVSVEDKNFKPKDDTANNTVITPTGTNTAAYAVSNWGDGGYTLTFTPNDAYNAPASNTLTATVYDLSGRSATFAYGDAAGAAGKAVDAANTPLSGNKNFALDIHAPQIAPGKGQNIPDRAYDNNYSDTLIFYKNATTLGIVVTDALGIESITGTGSNYTIGTVKGKAGDGEWIMEVALRNGVEFTDAFVLTATDVAHNVHTWKINPATLDVDDISTDAENTPIYSNLPNLYPRALILDTTAPALSLTDLGNDTYYNSPQTVTLNITELNFRYLVDYNGSQTVLTTTAEPGGNGSPQSPTAQVSDMTAVNAMAGAYTYSTTFSADGHYVVHAEVTDPAGNRTAIQTGRFTIDQTAPTATITWDNNNARNGMYYNAGRTATITVVEHNFLASDFTIETTGSIGGWSSSGDTHTCVVSFATDGRYTLTLSGHDRANNALASITEPEFVIDLTAPTIDFSDVAALTAYNDVIAPVINYHDEANFDTNGMEYTLTGSKHGAQTLAASQSSSGNDGTVAYSDFTREVEYDDIYTLSAHLTDMAGNEADNSITFSVNRFGSNFIIIDEEEFTEHNGYLAEPREIQVREINVSGALSEEHGVTVTHGLNTESLERKNNGTATSEGFYIESGNDSAGWSSYLYHIGSGNFADDGNYHVAINSTDAATNLNNSASYYDPDKHKLADAEVSFILDTADPIIDGISVSDGGTYDAGTTKVNFTVIDNIGVDSVDVTLDGQKVDDEDVQMDASGVVTVNAPAETFTPRNIEIVATDYAGRTAEAVVNGFHLTDSFIELNLPFVIGGAIVVVAAVVGGVVFVRRRNQQQ